ncbi:chorismate-binding protein [Lysinibacillus sp. 54212]|uniref:chorismate-binding protein n=1 Tax=Lysinibacillus sp. 54212 TaxID=3119829 RepID=UPI002FCA47E0
MIQHKLRTTIRKVNGDCLTPILIFNRLQGTRKVLLESSAKHESSGRYSFIGANPRKTYSGSGTLLTETSHITNKTYSYEGDLVRSLKQVMPRVTNHTEFPFTGGAIGYIRYGATIWDSEHENTSLPHVNFHVYDTIIIFDHLTDELIFVHTNIDPEQAEPNIDGMIHQILYGQEKEQETFSLSKFVDVTSQQEFDRKFAHVQSLIDQGEVTQIVLSQKFQAHFSGDAFSFYRHLRVNNPAPYMYYIEFDDHTVIGASPESILSVQNDTVKTNIIAGSRNRGLSTEEDAALEESLQNDEGVLSEHKHLLTISKEDLEKFCVADSIDTTKNLETVRYKHVMHVVSEIQGTLSPTLHAIDALSTLLPSSSVLGYPKFQAMRAIDEIEGERSLYGGAIGYIGFNGQLDFALATHSTLLQNGKVTVQTGSTIRASSESIVEYEKIHSKILKG